MSYIKKSLSLAFCLSLLTSNHICASQPEKQESIITGLFKFAVTSSFILIPFGIWHYYKNYYTVDHTSVESLLLSLNTKIIAAQNLIAIIFPENLDNSIMMTYPHFPYPYVTCHAQLENVLYNLYYYKNALNRKISRKEFSDTTVISNISNLILELERIKSAIEKTTKYQDQLRNEL